MTSIPPTRTDTNPESPETVGAFTSQAGDYFRREGIRVLTARYLELTNRAKRRLPTPVERKELDRCELALNTLQAMGGADGTP